MACVTHICSPTATDADAARLQALAVAALVEHPASRGVPVDELVAAAAAGVASAPAPTLVRT
jgi:hypothetical protein